MRSPFAIFRKYQRTLMVVITGLAMFAFVILGSVTQMEGPLPPSLLALILASILAVFGWLMGTRTNQGKEFALIAGAAGLIGGFILPAVTAPAPLVATNAGDLSDQDINRLVSNRQAANRFIQQAYFKTNDSEFARVPQQYMFGFGRPGPQDVVLGFLFRQKADEMGIRVTDDEISQYINQITSNKLSKEDFREIRSDMRVSEGELYDIFRDELKARHAMLLARPRVLPTPQDYWELYRQMHVKQALDVVPIPVEPFHDQIEQPSDSELIAYFAQYKDKLPTPYPQPTPSFAQPRKIEVAYLEADFETFEGQVGTITDEEIETYYNENKFLYRNNPIPDQTPSDPFENVPETPAGEPGSESSATEPGKNAEGANESVAPDESTTNPEPETKDSNESESTDDEPSTANFSVAPEDPSRPAPPPLPTTDGKTDTGTDIDIQPLPEFQPLDDLLRDQIRDHLLEVRTKEAMQARTQLAYEEMYRLGQEFHAIPLDDSPEAAADKPTVEQMAERLRAVAEKHELNLVEIGPVAFAELAAAEPDNPNYLIGTASDPVEPGQDPRNSQIAAIQLFEAPAELVFEPYEAVDFSETKRYVYWKTKDIAEHSPTLDEPGVREQVLAAWKREKARPLAEARAKELADMVRTGSQSMAEILADVPITDKPDAEKLAVRGTEEFSWIRLSTAPQANMFNLPRPEISAISAIPQVTNDFMKAIFEDLENGEVGVIPNGDQSIYYTVMVKQRTPSTENEEEQLRQAFLKEDLFTTFFSPYVTLVQQQQQSANYEWSRRIEAEFGVDWGEFASIVNQP